MRVLSACIFVFYLPVFAQTSATLTLAEAEALAIKNHPRIMSARLSAQAASEVTKQTRSAYFPTIFGNVTAVEADQGTSVAAGNVTTSTVVTRAAGGIGVNQTITDFGRTGALTKSARLRFDAQNQNVAATRAQIRLRVREAFFRALAAQSVLTVARQTLDSRRLTLRQVTALARSNLKSTLDVSFADVNVSQAELTLYRAENDIKSAFSELSAALGYGEEQSFQLTDAPLPAPLAAEPDEVVKDALRQRPDLITLRLNRDALASFAEGERRLSYPTLSALGVAGSVPLRQEGFRGHYGAAGVNLNIPLFNGGLYSARRAEADLHFEAANQDVKDLEIRVARDVKVAWLNANNAFRLINVTARLLEQATRSLQLAQSRYDLGLSSIVELNQAQLSQTSAEIAGAGAKYEYQIQRADLDYQTGALQ